MTPDQINQQPSAEMKDEATADWFAGYLRFYATDMSTDLGTPGRAEAISLRLMPGFSSALPQIARDAVRARIMAMFELNRVVIAKSQSLIADANRSTDNLTAALAELDALDALEALRAR